MPPVTDDRLAHNNAGVQQVNPYYASGNGGIPPGVPQGSGYANNYRNGNYQHNQMGWQNQQNVPLSPY